jgi:murein L,D-transpeptidase YcbB/YkuD
MGAVKFEFPNPLGIYLHDTPDKQLMLEDARQFSNGCVRLEDAARFERWLFGGALPRVDEGPEQQVDLAQPVPVYITYLPVRPEAGGLAVGPDPYGRVDAVPAALARLD